jgi:hypothetical protein
MVILLKTAKMIFVKLHSFIENTILFQFPGLYNVYKTALLKDK